MGNINFHLTRILIISLVIVFLISVFVYCEFGRQKAEIFTSLVDNDVRVHFIDVGQGDCALIQTNDGNILIDAGTFDSGDDILDYIDKLGITEFEYAIFTHPHADHIGSASKIVEKYDFKSIVLPDAISTSSVYEILLDTISNENCNVILGEKGKSFSVGDVKFDILAPASYYYKDDLNDMSIVTKMTYDEVSLIFTGDAEWFSEKEIVKSGYDLKTNILKVGHHGSSTSSTKDFLNAVSPEVAVISAGKNNEYGHPHDEVVKRLGSINTAIYITYEVGSIVITTDGKTYSIDTEK